MKINRLITSLAVLMLTLAAPTQAAPQPIFSFGGLNLSGISIIDTTDRLTTRGFFQVDQIRQADNGAVLYQSGQDTEIVGIFGGFNRIVTEAGLGGAVSFASNGGFVDFYEVASNTFQITGDYVVDTAGILAGNLLLGGRGHTDVNGYTATGSVTANTYTSTGSLDFIDGALLASFDNNSVTFQGADALFNLSGSRAVQYPFQGSSDVTTIEVSQVPLPASGWLLGSALLGIGSLSQRHKK